MAQNQPASQQLSLQVQQYVQKEARKIAEDVYSQQATKFGVSVTPLHKHNGLDSPKINASDLVAAPATTGNITMAHTGMFYIGLNSAKTGTSFKPSLIRFQGIAVYEITGFIVSPSTASVGAVYETSGTTATGGNTAVYFTVLTMASGATTLLTAGAGALVNTSGTLTLVSGSGDTHINYSAISSDPTQSAITIRASVVGDAFVNSSAGSSFYLQPQSSDSVVVGGPNQSVIQSSSCLIINASGSGGATLAEATEGSIVKVYFPAISSADLVARATIPDLGGYYSIGPGVPGQLLGAPIVNGQLNVYVELATGWWIQGNWVII